MDMLKELRMTSVASINRNERVQTYTILTKLRMVLYTTINRSIF
jgi:hypothetical protein